MIGITKVETRHGNSGERRILSQGLRVCLTTADNLPPESDIAYWASPLDGEPDWPEGIRRWAEDVGVGLKLSDVEIEQYSD